MCCPLPRLPMSIRAAPAAVALPALFLPPHFPSSKGGNISQYTKPLLFHVKQFQVIAKSLGKWLWFEHRDSVGDSTLYRIETQLISSSHGHWAARELPWHIHWQLPAAPPEAQKNPKLPKCSRAAALGIVCSATRLLHARAFFTRPGSCCLTHQNKTWVTV